MYRNHEAYRRAKNLRRLWYLGKFGAIALILGGIALAMSSGEGTHLLISVPAALFVLFGREPA